MNDTTATATADAPPVSPRDKLMADLRVVIGDAEELLKITAGQAGDKAADLRSRIEHRLAAARKDLARLQEDAAFEVRHAGRVADTYVRENPWTAVGIAAGVGLVLGLLISRR